VEIDPRLPAAMVAAIPRACLRDRAWKGMPGRDCLSSHPPWMVHPARVDKRTRRRPKCPK
jgi:hypothetical protein